MSGIKRFFFFILFTGCLIWLIGCTENNEFRIIEEDGTLLYAEVNDSLLVNATVKTYIGNALPNIYYGHHLKISHDDIDAFLANIGDSVDVVTQDEVFDVLFRYQCNCISGSTISYETDADGYYPHCMFIYNNREASFWYVEYPIYPGQNLYDEQFGRYVTASFTEPCELSIGSASDAETEVRQALAALGLRELILNRTLYLSHDRMEQLGEYLQEEEWKQIESAEYADKDSWTTADDGYYFEFFVTIDGLPLLWKDYETDTFLYAGTSVQVWYNAQGIVRLIISYPWAADEVIEKSVAICTAQEALNIAVSKLSNIITSDQRIITDITLVYMYFQNDDAWILKPVWDIRYQTPSSFHVGGKIYKHIIIDAISGQEV